MGRVLVVEDEPNIAGIIVFKLGREGHEVLKVETLGEVMPAVADFSPDLVLLDTSLDDGDALSILPALATPVVVMTELGDSTTGPRALDLGAARTVAKPFKPTVLARVVGELLG